MDAPQTERTSLAPQGLALPLHALFLKVAETEGYEEILACTLAAEWMFLTWCSAANQSLSSRAYIRNWVARYARGDFADYVAWVLANRRKRTETFRGAAERSIRTDLGGGNRFP